ncbi:MAG: rod shape-determining protein [Egibacteraceae bacterium]
MRDIAIDMGTASTLVWVKGRGIVLDEPTVVAVHQRGGEVRAMGHEAHELIAHGSGSFVAHRPLVGGAVTDFGATASLLRMVLRRLRVRRPSRLRLVVCIPSGLTDVERRALEQAAAQAGIGATYPISGPLAAAMGAGLAIDQPIGTMVVDAGGGSCKVAMISLGEIVKCALIRTGGFDIDDAIARYVRSRFDLVIGARVAEQVKVEIGSASPQMQMPEPRVEVSGRELAGGRPRTVTLAGDEVRAVIDPCVSAVLGAVLDVLGNCPPALAQDVVDTGLWLCGGGSKLRGLATRLAAETGLPVHTADRPGEAVIRGAGMAVEDPDNWKHLFA